MASCALVNNVSSLVGLYDVTAGKNHAALLAVVEEITATL